MCLSANGRLHARVIEGEKARFKRHKLLRARVAKKNVINRETQRKTKPAKSLASTPRYNIMYIMYIVYYI